MRIFQEVITVGTDPSIEVPVVLAVPAGPVCRDLSDVLVVLLLVVIAEIEDEAVGRRIEGAVVYLLGLPGVVIPVPVGVGLELLFLRFAAVVVVDVRDPGHALETQVPK